MKDNILVGRRAVYTEIRRAWDDDKDAWVEVSRKQFHGVIAAIVVTGSHPQVIMLYDDGALCAHDLYTITVEGDAVERL